MAYNSLVHNHPTYLSNKVEMIA